MEFSGMHYTMEQLVKALANETMSEISFDDAEVADMEDPTEEIGGGMWFNIAGAVIEEIDALYQGGSELTPYGYYADEVIMGIRPLLEPYAMYPAAHKLLSALEELITGKGKDSRGYTALVIRAIDSGAAKSWAQEAKAYK